MLLHKSCCVFGQTMGGLIGVSVAGPLLARCWTAAGPMLVHRWGLRWKEMENSQTYGLQNVCCWLFPRFKNPPVLSHIFV